MGREALNPRVDVLLAFSTGALEAVNHARDRGVFSVVDQLDPARVDLQLVLEEHARWPGWQPPHEAIPEDYFERLSAEWKAADMIVVNSEFSRRSIREQGVPDEKLLVVPLCYESEQRDSQRTRACDSGPLRVLWLGQIVLRKGIPYLFEAAGLLRDERIEFSIAGNVGISEKAVRSAPPNVRVIGRVTRDEALALYADSHVFVLPTISDGFAITQLEAMSFGLPVIATPNCGDVVTPGVDGLIVPIRDSQALAGAILRLHQDRGLLARMSAEAILKSSKFTLDRYAGAIETETLRRRAGRDRQGPR
jgi:glycosyltransferase involved in cell wall biosynthesis